MFLFNNNRIVASSAKLLVAIARRRNSASRGVVARRPYTAGLFIRVSVDGASSRWSTTPRLAVDPLCRDRHAERHSSTWRVDGGRAFLT